MLVFQEANATQMAEVFRKRVAVVKNFIPDVSDGIKSSVGDWTGESRQACDAALKRLEERGEELAELLTAAADARFSPKASMLSLKRLRVSTVKGCQS